MSALGSPSSHALPSTGFFSSLVRAQQLDFAAVSFPEAFGTAFGTFFTSTAFAALSGSAFAALRCGAFEQQPKQPLSKAYFA